MEEQDEIQRAHEAYELARDQAKKLRAAYLRKVRVKQQRQEKDILLIQGQAWSASRDFESSEKKLRHGEEGKRKEEGGESKEKKGDNFFPWGQRRVEALKKWPTESESGRREDWKERRYNFLLLLLRVTPFPSKGWNGLQAAAKLSRPLFL